MLSMIDVPSTRAQFAAFPEEIALRLLTATEADILEWTNRLLEAWKSGSEEDIRRARHSLKGLCGNFGATKLTAMSEGALDMPEAQEAFVEMRRRTLYAIRVVALGAPDHSASPLP